jgi:hypothetical protein
MVHRSANVASRRRPPCTVGVRRTFSSRAAALAAEGDSNARLALEQSAREQRFKGAKRTLGQAVPGRGVELPADPCEPSAKLEQNADTPNRVHTPVGDVRGTCRRPVRAASAADDSLETFTVGLRRGPRHDLASDTAPRNLSERLHQVAPRFVGNGHTDSDDQPQTAQKMATNPRSIRVGCDYQQLRRPVLYPPELRARIGGKRQ